MDLADSSTKLQVIITPETGENNIIKLFGLNSDNQSWEQIIKAGLNPKTNNISETAPNINPETHYPQKLLSAEFYNYLKSQGYEYEQKFQCIESLFKNENEAYFNLSLSEELISLANPHLIHLSVIDSCFNVLKSLIPEDSFNDYKIVSVEELVISKKLDKKMIAIVNLFPEKESETFNGNINIFDKDGNSLLNAKGIKLKNNKADFIPKELDDWLFETSWQEINTGEKNNFEKTKNWLVFQDKTGVGDTLKMIMESRGKNCITVTMASNFKNIGHNQYEIDPMNEDNFDLLFKDLSKNKINCHGIVHLWSLSNNLANQQQWTDYGIKSQISVMNLVKALVKNGINSLFRLAVITNGVRVLNEDKHPSSFLQAPVWGMGKVITFEYPLFNLSNIDLSSQFNTMEIQSLFDIISSDKLETVAAIRSDKKLSEVLVPYQHQPRQTKIEKSGSSIFNKVKSFFNENTAIGSATEENLLIQSNATYLITGGLGDLGLALTKWLIEKGAKYIVLTGRSNPSPKATEILENLRKISQIKIINGDISQEEDVKKLFSEIEKTMPPLKGIVHAAAVISDGIITQQAVDKFEKVLAPKAIGAMNLHKFIKNLNLKLDFFVMFSSLISQIGLPGMLNYAAANSFLDSFALYCQTEGLPAITINWGTWGEIGLAFRHDQNGRLKEHGFEYIPPEIALNLFERIISGNATQVTAMYIDLKKLYQFFPSAKKLSLLSEIAEKQGLDLDAEIAEHIYISEVENNFPESTSHIETAVSDHKKKHEISKGAELQPKFNIPAGKDGISLIENHIKDQVSQILRMPASKIDINLNLRDYGFDSIMAIELRNKMENIFHIELATNSMSEFPTINSLAAYITTLLPVEQVTLEAKN